MLSRIAQMILLASVLASPLLAQGSTRMWYRGPFDGWVDVRSNPAPGYYYQPSPNPAYPLQEWRYGQPVPCRACGHTHYPGSDVCPVCGRRCPAGGNDLNPNSVYSPAPLPGQYWFQEQPHYRFTAPMRLGWPYRKYDRPYN